MNILITKNYNLQTNLFVSLLDIKNIKYSISLIDNRHGFQNLIDDFKALLNFCATLIPL